MSTNTTEQQDTLSIKTQQPWWQYYYQLYQYQLPPGRKPTVFGPFLLLQTLGEGEFGKVKFGIEVKTGKEVAIKLMKKDSIDSTSRMTKVEREISVLRILRHPNIVELFDVIETEKYIGIILQCATGGELFDYILAHRYLKEKDASRLFAQLISGVHYMHQHRIVHRDLKLENLLLDRNRNILITDFGFANQFTTNDLMSTSCGSPCYAAPELVMNQGCYVGPAVDIWSCGVILFAMLCGYLPYDDDPANPESYNINLLYKYILNTPLVFPEYISEEACDLMRLMLVPDPDKRGTMEAIMAHPWLTPHRHLFGALSNDQVVPETVPETNPVEAANNTEKEEKDTISSSDNTIENTLIPRQSTDSHIIPLVLEREEETPTESQENKQKTTSNESIVPSIDKPPELPPKDIPPSPKPSTPIINQKENKDDAEDEEEPLSPLPTIKPTPTHRPRSIATEKMLSFLSPTSTYKKRTRHTSLAETKTTPEESILHSKFLNSMKHHHHKPVLPVRPNSSVSTPLKDMKPGPPRPNTAPTEGNSRRKTLSLLVNSMDIPFTQHRRRDEDVILPSVSERVPEKKSAGKKFIDWFKKKPLSTMHRPNVLETEHDVKLRTHHGAVDQEALTSRVPVDVVSDIKEALTTLGLEYKRDGSEFKLKCVRPKQRQQPLMRRQPQPPTSLYGDPNVDPGDEVRFSVELCKIKNLPGLYIVDMRRLRGNVWSYKFIYRTLMDTLQ